MSIFSVVWLCLGFPGAVASTPEQLSPEELQVAVAALEKRFSKRPTIELAFRTRSEWKPDIAKPPNGRLPPESTSTWHHKAGKQSYSEKVTSDPAKLLHKWTCDGQSTHDWHYEDDRKPDYGKLSSISTYDAVPRRIMTALSHFPFALGFESFNSEIDLPSYLKLARQNKTLSGSRLNDLVEIALGPHGSFDTTLTVDPAHDYRLLGWKSELADKTRPSRGHSKFAIDEFQSVADEATGEMISFPKRMRRETPLGLVWIDVDSVRINHDIPDGQFVHQEMPMGTRLIEERVGQKSRISIVGGGKVIATTADQRNQQYLLERARLDREGVKYDATPPVGSSGMYWGALGCVLFVTAGAWRMCQRR